jgi:integrase
MAKLRYFIQRIRGKNKIAEYFWQAKPSVAEKYQITKFKALGKNRTEALIEWEKLDKQLSLNITTLKEKGFLIPKKNIEKDTLRNISEFYFKHRKFTDLAESTKKDYTNYINKINEMFGDEKISFFTRSICEKFYIKILEDKGIRTAQHYINALRIIWNAAKDHDIIEGENPCSVMKIKRNKPRDQVWSNEEFNLFCHTALKKGYKGLYVAMNVAYYTSQRETDILSLKWSQIDENFNVLSFNQSKTGAKIYIPLEKLTILKEILIKLERKSEYVIVDEIDNKPYNSRVRLFLDRFDNVKKISNIREELWFRDLRRTSILALDEAGCSSSEIASISGHSRSSILKMLDVYAPKTIKKAENAFEKLNNYDRK